MPRAPVTKDSLINTILEAHDAPRRRKHAGQLERDGGGDPGDVLGQKPVGQVGARHVDHQNGEEAAQARAHWLFASLSHAGHPCHLLPRRSCAISRSSVTFREALRRCVWAPKSHGGGVVPQVRERFDAPRKVPWPAPSEFHASLAARR